MAPIDTRCGAGLGWRAGANVPRHDDGWRASPACTTGAHFPQRRDGGAEYGAQPRSCLLACGLQEVRGRDREGSLRSRRQGSAPGRGITASTSSRRLAFGRGDSSRLLSSPDDSRARHTSRTLRNRRTSRRGRDGRGVSRTRPAAGPSGRNQGPACRSAGPRRVHGCATAVTLQTASAAAMMLFRDIFGLPCLISGRDASPFFLPEPVFHPGLLSRCHDEDVEYVRATEDIDVLVRASRENGERIRS